MAYVEPEKLEDKEIVLIYVAANTTEARRAEGLLTADDISYTLGNV